MSFSPIISWVPFVSRQKHTCLSTAQAEPIRLIPVARTYSKFHQTDLCLLDKVKTSVVTFCGLVSVPVRVIAIETQFSSHKRWFILQCHSLFCCPAIFFFAVFSRGGSGFEASRRSFLPPYRESKRRKKSERKGKRNQGENGKTICKILEKRGASMQHFLFYKHALFWTQPQIA